ncbi:ABC transporter ATP-binding protein [Vibrio sp. HA2012]|uniref:ABC transporter ATP-binding protein n=1 Tax=Vibrio sp. HA2012 TaxID=1971595 RepID=UPI000C2BDC0A|nr:ABC transporter ATP-binding protein [Vibrio sp. HA2012]PJC87717.1 ABC transporter ATP-binding protein [Vibrio sp. HA2012]
MSNTTQTLSDDNELLCEENPSTHSDWQSLHRLWQLAGPLKTQVAKGILFRFIQSFCLGLGYGVAILMVTSLVADDFIPTTEWLTSIIFWAVLSLTGQVVFSFLSARQCWFASFQLARDLRLKMLDKLRKLPLGFHFSQHRGDAVTMITTDMQMIESFLSDGLPRIAEASGLPIAVLLFLLYQDINLFCAGAASIVLALPVYLITSRHMAKLGLERQDIQAAASARMIEYVQGMSVIKAFNRIAKGQEDFRLALSEFRTLSNKMVRQLTFPLIIFGTLIMLGIPLIMYADSVLLLSDELPLATFITALMLIYALYSPLLGLIPVMEQTRLADASLTRIDRILTEQPLPEPIIGKEPDNCSIDFHNVTFGYHADVPVLNELSFSTGENTMTAIVGPSGAGKSTVLNLVARFWDPNAGNVSIGGVDIRDIKAETLNTLITVVFQDVFLFSGTVLDNITLGKKNATMAEVKHAACMAQAHDFIMSLPNGYQTHISEGGSTLSGGERQRLSIARAILKDAPIVIMDEATAAIDPTNELAFQKALQALTAHKTVIVVAHKLSTISNADQIVVLESGKIIEKGTHQTLVKQSGLYSDLWKRWTQAADWHIRHH